MRSLEALAAALAEREHAARQRRIGGEADQRLGPDQLAGRAEQGMAALDPAQENALDVVKRPLDQARIDELES